MNKLFYVLISEFIILIIMFGVISNFQVIQANKGLMPVYTDYPNIYIKDNKHFYYNDPSTINKSYLADNYKVFDTIYSLKDILMCIGLFLFIVWNSIILFSFFRSINFT